MSKTECANDYIWYTIQPVGAVNYRPTYKIYPDNVSLDLPHFDKILAQYVPMTFEGLRSICCHRYNRPVAFKYIPLVDDLEYE